MIKKKIGKIVIVALAMLLVLLVLAFSIIKDYNTYDENLPDIFEIENSATEINGTVRRYFMIQSFPEDPSKLMSKVEKYIEENNIEQAENVYFYFLAPSLSFPVHFEEGAEKKADDYVETNCIVNWKLYAHGGHRYVNSENLKKFL